MISGIAFVVALHSTAALAGAKIPIDGVVLHVDKLHHQATIKYAALDTAPGGVRVVAITDPKPSDVPGSHVYSASVSSDRPLEDYAARLVPHFDGVSVPLENARILWQR